MQRPTGLVAVAVLCFLIAGYIGAAGVWMLVWRKTISTMPGATQLPGIQMGGPYPALLVGIMWIILGWGLLKLRNWARWAAMLVAVWGIASGLAQALVFSARFGWPVLLVGFQIVVRIAVVWYLLRSPVADQFRVAKTA
jgi:hypothetical protein